MKLITIFILLTAPFLHAAEAEDLAALKDKNIIGLNAIKEKNAGIKTVEPQTSNFEKTLFSIGRIQAIPANHTVISSRIAGRVVSRPPIVGDFIQKDQLIVNVESRQPGSPPPVIAVKAPASGFVFKSHVQLGEPVDPTEELMDIVDISQVWAVADIPESQAHRVKIGQTAHIKVVSLGNQPFKGTLIRFGTEADADAGTIKAIFLLDNPNNKLRPNMLTEFSIVTSTRKDVFSVPKSAIQGDTLNAHVFKRHFAIPYAYKRVPVVVGETNHNRAEIILQNNELIAFDKIVTQGAYYLSHTSKDNTDLVKALDEAHGHKHNPDGSEMTAADKAAESGGEAAKASPLVITLLSISNAIFFCLLMITIIKKQDVS